LGATLTAAAVERYIGRNHPESESKRGIADSSVISEHTRRVGAWLTLAIRRWIGKPPHEKTPPSQIDR
jgi:hypothetical protein